MERHFKNMTGYQKFYLFLRRPLHIAAACLFPLLINAQRYVPVDASSSIKVIIKNVGMDTEGTLTGIRGNIYFDPATLKTAVFAVTVDAASINTDIAPRDAALRGPDFLQTDKYPTLGFTSSKVTALGAGKFLLRGSLTIKGITKEISFPFTAVQQDGGMMFRGEMRLNRKDFNLAPGSIVLSDNFTVTLKVFAVKE